MINLLDRQMLSVLAPMLREQWSWSDAQYGYVAVDVQLRDDGRADSGRHADGSRRHEDRPGDHLHRLVGDLRGARGGRTGHGDRDASRAPIWSDLPGMPVLGAGLAGFMLLRFLMGVSECGNYTAGIKALAGLFPADNALEGRRRVQRRRAARIGHRAAADPVASRRERSVSAGRWRS